MKLQLSLDQVELEEALDYIEEIKDLTDIVEVGTPLALKYGRIAVQEIKKKYPQKTLLADYKIIDGGNYEASIAFDAGADIVTVLGLADIATINGTVTAARTFQKKTMVDLIGVGEIAERIQVIETLGVDYVCVHTAMDVQNGSNSPIDALKLAKSIVKNMKVAVAGGIRLENIDEVVRYDPEIVIIGTGILSKPDRYQAALEIVQRFK